MTDQTQVLYNPFEPGFTEDPYPQYRELRAHDPVHQTLLGFWFLSKWDDVNHFLRDQALSVEDQNAGPSVFDAMFDEAMEDRMARRGEAMLNRDPPDHTRLRRLVSKAFTPRRIAELRPRIQELVDEALDKAEARGSMDLVDDLAFPLPFAVISEMMGMPPGIDTEKLREWSGMLVRTLEPPSDLDLIRRIADAGEKMEALVREAIAWKRDHVSDDLLSALIAAEDGGDMLSDDELIAQVTLIYIAGHETTVNLIGNGTLALLRNRAQLERLHANPELAPQAVEEFLRFDPPVQMSRRITLEDVEVRGRTIPKGTFVICGLASANRDEEKFGANSEELDITRENAKEHVAFGGGAHFCLGAALARLEGSVAVGTLVKRFPNVELAGDPVYNGRINLRGLDHLPLTLA